MEHEKKKKTSIAKRSQTLPKLPGSRMRPNHNVYVLYKPFPRIGLKVIIHFVLSSLYRIPFFYSSNNHHCALDVLKIMKSAKDLKMPFPSFTLVLSHQEAGDNSIQERNASESNVKPPVDLLVSL